MSKKNKTDSGQQTPGAKGGSAANRLGKTLDQLSAEMDQRKPFLSIFGHGRRQGETQAAKLIGEAHEQHRHDQERKGAFRGVNVDPKREKMAPQGNLTRGQGARIDGEAENSPANLSSATSPLPLPRSNALRASEALFWTPLRETEVQPADRIAGTVETTPTIPSEIWATRPGKAKKKSKPAPSRFWRYRWAKLGGHIHVTVFVSTHPKQTYANCGELVMSTRDWNSFRDNLSKTPGVEILEAE